MMFLNAEEQQVFYLIKNHADYAKYFFSKVKSKKWFDPLYTDGFFSPEKIPFDENGNTLFWDELGFLERISELTHENRKFGIELVAIVNSMILFSLKKRKINNYHIWWHCIKILNNLPTDLIKEQVTSDRFREWLSVWLDHTGASDMIADNIGEILLPKFLADEYGPDFNHVREILDALTQLKAVDDQFGLVKRKHAELARDSYWLRTSFHKYAEEIGRKCSNDRVFRLADRLKIALEFEHREASVVVDSADSTFRIMTGRFTQSEGDRGIPHFEARTFFCRIQQYAPDQLKGIDRGKDIFKFHELEPAILIGEFPPFHANDKKGFVSGLLESLPPQIDFKGVEGFEEKIESLFNGLHTDYSHIHFKSIAHSRNDPELEKGAVDVLITMVRDILRSRCETDKGDGAKIVKAFLGAGYPFPIFRRLALLCMDRHWNEYGEMLEIFFDLTPDVLEEPRYEVELYDILQNHYQSFSEQVKDFVRQAIDRVPEYYQKEGADGIAYWKRKWLSPLRDNPDFRDQYNEVKLPDGKPYHPDREVSRDGFFGHKSPLSKEAILEMPVFELVKVLVEFKDVDGFRNVVESKPDRDGLADELLASGRENPKRFTDELLTFLNTGYFFIHQILRGILEAWKSGRDLDWEKVFCFAIAYLENGKEAIEKEKSQSQAEDKYSWGVRDIVDLIEAGCRDDKHAFDQIHFRQVESIFDSLDPLLTLGEFPELKDDAMIHALNTTLGRTVMAYVTFSLRVARVKKDKEDKEARWGNNKFERFFRKGGEALIWFGHYLPQMSYLDENYVTEKIGLFAKNDASDCNWQMFMAGYLSNGRLFRDVYQLMRANYSKALEYKEFSDDTEKRLVEHVCIGYLHYDDSLAERNSDGSASLVNKMLLNAGVLEKPDRWMMAVRFFLTYGKDQAKSDEFKLIRERILDFWAWIFREQEIVKANTAGKHGPFLGEIAEFVCFLDKIDEERERWLTLSAPYVESHRHGAYFIESLARFDDKESVQRIGRTFLKVLENSTPIYNEEDIQLIVKRLYDCGEKGNANEICDMYGWRGIHVLRQIWNEHNPGSVSSGSSGEN
jgi:hypothetical protein